MSVCARVHAYVLQVPLTMSANGGAAKGGGGADGGTSWTPAMSTSKVSGSMGSGGGCRVRGEGRERAHACESACVHVYVWRHAATSRS